MANPTCNWSGLSGKNYAYSIWPRGSKFNPNQMGNYIYARQNPQGQWVPIYIGEGDLAVRCSQSHHQQECLNSRGATHVHVHLNANEMDRLSEERDLLARYTNAYAPSGCNLKLGG